MNYTKLLKFNMSRPIQNRVSQFNLAEAIENAIAGRFWRKGMATLEAIKAEVEPQLLAMREAQAKMDAIGSVSGGMSCRIPHRATRDCPIYSPYSLGTMEPKLDRENNVFADTYSQASERAREHTQTTAGGQHSMD